MSGMTLSPQQVGNASPSELRRRMAAQLLMQGGSTEPVQHWTQGAARVAQGLMGGLELNTLDRERRQGNKELADFILSRAGGAPAAAPPAAPGAAPAAEAPQAPTIPYAPPQVPASTTTANWSPTGGDSSLIPPALVRSESGGNFAAQNAVPRRDGTVGHFGRLQFSTPRLEQAAAAGVIPPGTTPQAFMASPEMQRAVEQWHFSDIDQFVQRNGLSSAIGTQIGGTTVTPEGMRAVAHLGGNEGLRRFITSGGQYNPADANGTRLSMYLAQNAGGPPGPQAQGGPAPAGAPPVAAPAGPAARPGMIQGMDRATLVRLLDNEYTAPMVTQMIAAELAPAGLQLVQRPDGTFAFNPRTGQMTQVGPRPPRDPVVTPAGAVMRDPTTGAQIGPSNGFRPLTDPGERRRLGIPDTDRRAYQQGPDGRIQAVQDTPNTNTTLSVNTATNPLVEGYSRQFTQQRESASAAADTIRALHQARAQLDEPGGVITGALAEGRMGLARIGALFGVTDERSLVNTESFRAAVGQQVLSGIRALGANPSNNDVRFMERVAAGDIALNETTIRRVLDLQERYARQAIERYNQTFGQVSDELSRTPGADQSGLAIMRALGRVGMPGEYAPPTAPAPGAPPGQQPPGVPQAQPQQPPANLPRPTSRQEMEALPPGTQFIAPDGNVRVRP